ncbi:MAG: DNRLRE domain-containing protein [Candidatus Schekmanbacteria bacterium]|nr:DNRLRE domain-containing protein [Candidatus Schekmanbacteria bacterium]
MQKNKAQRNILKYVLVISGFLSILPPSALGEKRDLYIITGAHQDIGYGFTYTDSMNEYAEQLRSHIDLIESDPEIRFSMGNTWNTKDFLQRYPKYKTRLKNLLAAGKISTPAQWVSGEVNWLPGEFLVRTIIYPKFWCMSELDYAPHWYQLNDVPSITPQLGQILAKSDIYFLQITHPVGLTYNLDYAKFWYFVGLDGSRVPLYNVDYGDAINLSDGFNDWDSEADQWSNTWSTRFKDFPVKLSLSATDRGTDAERSQRLKANIAHLNEKYSPSYGFNAVMKTEEDYALYVKKEIIDKKVSLPEITGTAHPWPWGGSAYSFGATENHNKATHLLLTTEKLAAINELLGISAYPAQQIDSVWEKLFWYPEHNWGGNSDTGAYKQKDNQAALKETRELLSKNLKTLSGAVNYNGKGTPLLVFNPLNWERSETISVTLPNPPSGNWALRDSQENIIPAQLSVNQEGKKEILLFLAKNIPALGYKTFYLTDKLPYDPGINTDLKAKENYIENTFYKVTVYPDGSLKSIYDKQENRELVNDAQEQKFGNINPSAPKKVVPAHFDIIEQGPARTSIRVKGQIYENLPYTVTISLSAYTPWVEHNFELDTTQKRKGQGVNFFYYAPFQNLAERGQIGIPYAGIPNMKQDDYFTKISFARRAPGKGFDIADGRNAQFAPVHKDIQKWLNIGDDNYSVDLAFDNLQTRTYFKNPVTPMVHLAGVLPSSILQWRFLIRGHKGNWKENNSPRFGWEASNPVLAVCPDKSNSKKLPESLSFLEIATPANPNANNTILTTFKKALDGNGYIMRFYETEDEDTKVAIKANPLFNLPQAEVCRTNLLEIPFETLPLKDEHYTLDSLGYGIETVRFFPQIYTDTTKPSAVDNLKVSNISSSTVKLTWTASGGDNKTGTAKSYDLRFSTAPIREDIWEKVKNINLKNKPGATGKQEQITVTGLKPETNYYFALKVIAESGNKSPISNIADGKTEGADITPPAAVTNLSIIKSTVSSISLQWAAGGDDGTNGLAFKYMVGYAAAPITDANWSTVNIVNQRAGQSPQESVTISGLFPATQYYFAVRAIDESGNISPLSNNLSHNTTQIKTVSFQNGVSPSPMYQGCSDTHLSDVNELEVEVNYGEYNYTRNWAWDSRLVLIRFSFDPIPKGTPIHKATLKLFSHDIAYGDAGNVSAYRITQHWEENETTWIKATARANWQTPGGSIDQSTDYGNGANGIVAKGPVSDKGTWVSLDVTRLVQDWIAGKTPNYGLLIKGNCAEDCEIYYRSAEYKESRLRPILEVSY